MIIAFHLDKIHRYAIISKIFLVKYFHWVCMIVNKFLLDNIRIAVIILWNSTPRQSLRWLIHIFLWFVVSYVLLTIMISILPLPSMKIILAVNKYILYEVFPSHRFIIVNFIIIWILLTVYCTPYWRIT